MIIVIFFREPQLTSLISNNANIIRYDDISNLYDDGTTLHFSLKEQRLKIDKSTISHYQVV